MHHEGDRFQDVPSVKLMKENTKLANRMRQIEAKKFKDKRAEFVNRRTYQESEIMGTIPKSLLNPKIKNKFMQSREAIMQRTINTEDKNKMISERTHNKMLVKA